MKITVRAEQGERADFPNLGTRFLVGSEQTDGSFALLEHTVPSRRLAAPTHVHEREDEYSFVLVGLIGAHVGGEEVEAGPGELIVKPRGIPHAFWNPGDEEARLLELISPGGFERYFVEMAPLLAGGGPPDPEAVSEIRGRYRLGMDLSSVEPLIKRHGLQA
jgi:mannose-6-phosphate isomerase-like protein (cupin superfamily)